MSATPSRPEPANDASPAQVSPDPLSQRDEDAHYYRQVLHELIEIGADLARTLHRQAAPESNSEPTAAPEPAPTAAPQPDPTIAFDRIARTLRRTIALARKLTDPAPLSSAERRAEHASERRRIARKQIIREVEDTIQRRAEGADAEALHAEFYERLETIDCEDDIANLPIAEIIALIRRDLGLAHLPGTHPWKRRTPGDVMDLHARAAQPRTTQPKTAQPRMPQPGIALPRPFSAPPPRTPTSTGPPPP